MKRWKESFHPYAMITIVFWSLAYGLTRIALQYFSAFSLGFLRYLTASLAMLVYAAATKMKPPKGSDLKWFLAAGASGFFLYMIFFNKGCETVSASASSVILATVPVMTALLARFVLGEILNRMQWAAIFIEFAGVVILTLMNGFAAVNGGILWLIFAAAALSIYNLLQRRLTKTYTALQTSAISIFTGTALLGVFSPAAMGELEGAPVTMMVSVLVLGVFSSAVAYAAWSQAFAKADKTSSVSNYMFVTPFLASLLGFVLAGERPDTPTVAGGIVILSGMTIFYFGEEIRKRVRFEKNDEKCRKT